MIPACLELETQWCRANNCAENQALENERRSMTAALQHLEQLDVIGGVLYVEDEIVALYFWGHPSIKRLSIPVWKKQNTAVEGAYAMINYEFANHIPSQYIYINREEDLGLEGLRKAKLSYQPEVILEKIYGRVEMSVKEQVRRLWATCFHDSEAFMDLYFGCRYTDSLNEYMESDGQVIAALQRIPYRLTYEGMNVPVAYISGACTHPVYRERGVMRKLLAQAHQSMFREGMLFSTLIPAEDWLKGYYARSGYTLCFQRRKKLLTASCLPVENFPNRWKLVEIPLETALCGGCFPFFMTFFSLIVKTVYSIIGKISTSYWRIYFCREASCGEL